MLEGIKVLSENYAHILPTGWWISLLVGLFGSVIGIVGIIIACDEHSLGGIIFTSFCSLICLSLIGICIYYYTNKAPTTYYKVTIDDTVNFKEFNDRYEIKDQEGEIYTIVEREK